MTEPDAWVVAVSRERLHRFSKTPVTEIELVAGIGVLGDAHAGTLVQHRSRKARQPNQVNLRQVHLIGDELLDEARAAGHDVGPGSMGENLLTRGIDLLALGQDTELQVGEVRLRVTGLRNPCHQINTFSPGLLKVVVARADGVRSSSDVALSPTGGADNVDGVQIVRRAGVMAIVERGGTITAGLPIRVCPAPGPHQPLAPV